MPNTIAAHNAVRDQAVSYLVTKPIQLAVGERLVQQSHCLVLRLTSGSLCQKLVKGKSHAGKLNTRPAFFASRSVSEQKKARLYDLIRRKLESMIGAHTDGADLDRSENDPEAEDQDYSLHHASLHCFVPRSHQHFVCEAHDGPGLGHHQPSVRARGWDFLYRLFSLRDPEQPLLAQNRCPHLAGAHPDYLGNYFRAHRVCAKRATTLRGAFFPRVGRSGLFSRNYPIFDLLVSLGAEQAQVLALLLIGIPITASSAAPLSGLILDHAHWLGLSSWRWLFILEGLPAVVGGVLTYYLLPSRPAEARFLTEDEKHWIIQELKQEEEEKRQRSFPFRRQERWLTVVSGIWHASLLPWGLRCTSRASGCLRL